MVKEEKKYEFIGGNIRKARELSGLSQRQLAEKLGYESSTTVSYIESGERKVSIVDLEKIATLLDRDIRYFIGQPEEQLKSFELDFFKDTIEYAKLTGFDEYYLWGAEWWYYMKVNERPEFWEEAKKLWE